MRHACHARLRQCTPMTKPATVGFYKSDWQHDFFSCRGGCESAFSWQAEPELRVCCNSRGVRPVDRPRSCIQATHVLLLSRGVADKKSHQLPWALWALIFAFVRGSSWDRRIAMDQDADHPDRLGIVSEGLALYSCSRWHSQHLTMWCRA